MAARLGTQRHCRLPCSTRNSCCPKRHHCRLPVHLLAPCEALPADTYTALPAGTGTAVLHCHILPHEDEGCMMKTQILEAK